MLQVVLEAILVVLILIFLLKNRGPKPGFSGISPEMKKAMNHFLVESEKLATTFNDALKQKKELSVNLLLKLERKITELNSMLEKAERAVATVPTTHIGILETDKANPAAPENRALVLRLAEQGLSVEEIARRARLHRGEVELIIDLEKQLN
ncbi:MAG: hypothetical protein HQK55_09330 [Deltaproteobacteria bacterium]|nr:hypothetical protein [Deltaproteobacteria bacterium]